MFEYVSQYTKHAFPLYSHFVCGSRRGNSTPLTHTHTHWGKVEVCLNVHSMEKPRGTQGTKYNQARTRAEKCHTPVHQAGLVMQGIDTLPAAYQTALANKSSPIRVCLPALALPSLTAIFTVCNRICFDFPRCDCCGPVRGGIRMQIQASASAPDP